MAEPINLNKMRKVRADAEAKVKAAENRVRFGRTKAEKMQQAADLQKLARDLEGRKRDC